MRKNNKKNVAVLFSSGLDSTYLVHKNLLEGNTVTPVYIEIKNNENKTKIEKQNVKMLCRIFRKNFNTINDPLFTTEIGVNSTWGNSHDLIFAQVPIWIFGMMYIPLTKFDEIHVGYVANDDAISYTKEIQSLFNGYKWLCSKPEKFPKLKFPLIKIKKYQMIDELPNEYKPYITSCENPTLKQYWMKKNDERLQFYEPCGICDPCRRIIKDEHPYNELYRKMCSSFNEKVRVGEKFYQLKQAYPKEVTEFEVSMHIKESNQYYPSEDSRELKTAMSMDVEA